jgi:cardiolipin synthase
LPDRQLIGALAVAARRGVVIDIVLPAKSNLPMIDYAVTAHLEEVVKTGCSIWHAKGPFDHSKLMTVDSEWAYIGSSNFDPRSFRLNFEIDLEVFDPILATWIENHIYAHIAKADLVTAEKLASRKLWHKMRDRTFWLASPYM